jgi:hypothetical protein
MSLASCGEDETLSADFKLKAFRFKAGLTKPGFFIHRNIAGLISPDFSFERYPYNSCRTKIRRLEKPCKGRHLSSALLAGVVNLAGHNNTNTTQELTVIYSNISTNDFRDIVSGTDGSFSCKIGYDFVTGVGSNIGTSGK